MEKKLIVFDLDETLRKLEFDNDYKEIIRVYLRPNINKLLDKLKEVKEVKEDGTDIMIWTTASSESVQKYFIECLPEEYRDIFDKVISGDNKIELENGSKEQKVYGYDTSNKPVTAIEGYNQILFFDDNRTEAHYLKKMYENDETVPEKQVIFSRYRYEPEKPYRLYAYKKLSEINENIAEKVNNFFEKLLEEPGCDFMIEQINEFQKMEFNKGLTIDNGDEKMRQYRNEKSDINDEIGDMINEDDELKKMQDEFMGEYISMNDKSEEIGDVTR